MRWKYLDYSVELPDEHRFSIPIEIESEERYGYYIVISPENGNWIVLENANQIDIFESFKNGNSIAEIKEKFKKNIGDIEYVICQISGRHFEDKFESTKKEPFSLRIYLTNKCNLRCTHCFMYAGEEKNNELNAQEICQLIQQSHANGADQLILTGGEVCLSDSFFLAMKTAKSLGMYIQVLSNGTCWSDKEIEEAACYIDNIQISIDGYDEESNAKVRGKGMFEKSLLAAERFIEKGVYTCIVSTPTYDSLEEDFEKYILFGKELVCRFGNESFCIMFGDEIINGRNIEANKEKNKRYKELIYKVCEEIYPNYELTSFIRKHEYNRIHSNCGYGTLTVSSVGDVYFCGRIFDVKKYGNIRTIDFDKIVNLREKAREKTKVTYFTPCNVCDIRYICGGGCRVAHIPKSTRLELENNEEILLYRECTIEEKENIYRLMIETNDFIMW